MLVESANVWVGGVGGAEKVTFLLQLSDGVCEAGGVVGDMTGGYVFVRGYLDDSSQLGLPRTGRERRLK